MDREVSTKHNYINSKKKKTTDTFIWVLCGYYTLINDHYFNIMCTASCVYAYLTSQTFLYIVIQQNTFIAIVYYHSYFTIMSAMITISYIG